MRKSIAIFSLLFAICIPPAILIAKYLHAQFSLHSHTWVSFLATAASAFIAISLLFLATILAGWFAAPKGIPSDFLAMVRQRGNAAPFELPVPVTIATGKYPLLTIIRNHDDLSQVEKLVLERIRYLRYPEPTGNDLYIFENAVRGLKNSVRLRLPETNSPAVCEILIWKSFKIADVQKGNPPKIKRSGNTLELDFMWATALPSLIRK